MKCIIYSYVNGLRKTNTFNYETEKVLVAQDNQNNMIENVCYSLTTEY